MKEREKMFTAQMVLIICIFMLCFVMYKANFFGIYDMINDSKEPVTQESNIQETETPPEVEAMVKQIESCLISGKFGELYDMGDSDFKDKGSRASFIEYCERGLKDEKGNITPLPFSELIKGKENLWEAVYENESARVELVLKTSTEKPVYVDGIVVIKTDNS